jgi:hypothetical protein
MLKISSKFIFLLFFLTIVIPSFGNATSPGLTASTQVIVYKPSIVQGIDKKEGTCWTNSIAAPSRLDAWRCNIGNEIEDPCFVYEKDKSLLCGVDPTKAKAGFLLMLTKPLPSQANLSRAADKASGWLLQLADGSVCSPFQGTMPILRNSKKSAMYACNDNTVLFEQFKVGATWQAEKANLVSAKEFGSNAESIRWVAITKIWQ